MASVEVLDYRRGWGVVCLRTITNFPESFLIVISGGAAIFVVLFDLNEVLVNASLGKWSEPCLRNAIT